MTPPEFPQGSALPQARGTLSPEVAVWDLPLRLFHWALVVCVVSALLSHKLAVPLGDFSLRWHRWNGYAVLVLLVFRVLWGIWGGSSARFCAFWPKPSAIRAYLHGVFRGHKLRYLGHNPLGALMILTLLGALCVQAGLGLFVTEHNGITAGPLARLISDEWSEALTKVHIRFMPILLGLVLVHIVANVLYGRLAKEPLIRAMVTGKKPPMPYIDAQAAVFPQHVGRRALLTLLAAFGIVFGGIMLAGGRIF